MFSSNVRKILILVAALALAVVVYTLVSEKSSDDFVVSAPEEIAAVVDNPSEEEELSSLSVDKFFENGALGIPFGANLKDFTDQLTFLQEEKKFNSNIYVYTLEGKPGYMDNFSNGVEDATVSTFYFEGNDQDSAKMVMYTEVGSFMKSAEVINWANQVWGWAAGHEEEANSMVLTWKGEKRDVLMNVDILENSANAFDNSRITIQVR